MDDTEKRDVPPVMQSASLNWAWARVFYNGSLEFRRWFASRCSRSKRFLLLCPLNLLFSAEQVAQLGTAGMLRRRLAGFRGEDGGA